MANDLEVIQTIESKSEHLLNDANNRAHEIKHQALINIQIEQEENRTKIEGKVKEIIRKAEQKAEKEAQAVIQSAESEAQILSEKMNKNIEKAADFIVQRIISGSSKS